MKSPCMICEKREIGCHAVCEDYAAYRAALNELNDAIRKARKAQIDADSFLAENYRSRLDLWEKGWK